MVYPNRVVLNINQKYVMPIPYTQQGDTARILTFNILDKGVPFNLSGKTVRAKILKPDNTKCYNDLTITNATGGECDLKLTNQVLAVAGKVNCQLEIKEGEELLSTIIFPIDVEPSIDINGAVESTNEFTALLNGIIKLDEWDKYFKETSGQIEQKYTVELNNVKSSLEEKVNKEQGKGLSTNDYTDTEQEDVAKIPSLATSSYVDTKIGNMGNVKTFKGSCLYSALPSSATVDDYWYVTDRKTNFCWNGTSWVDIGDNLNIGEKTVAPEMTTFFTPSKNLFNKETVTKGYYVKWDTGKLVANANSSVSEFMDISHQKVFYLNNRNQVAFYNENEDYVSGLVGVNKFERPEGVKYVRLTVTTSLLDTTQLEVGDKFTGYEPFKLLINPMYVPQQKEEGKEVVEYVIDKTGIGKFASIQTAIDSINDASPNKIYDLLIMDGIYEESVKLKDYINLKGVNKNTCIIDFVGTDTANISSYGAVYATCTSTIENLWIKNLNGKYPIHSDAFNNGYSLKVKNCILEHLGNSDNEDYGGCPFGIGLYENQHIEIEDCDLRGFNKSNTAGIPAIFCHNSKVNAGFRSLKVKGCNMTGVAYGLNLESVAGSAGQNNLAIFEDNYIQSKLADVRYTSPIGEEAWELKCKGNNIRKTVNVGGNNYIVEEAGFTKRIVCGSRKILKGDIVVQSDIYGFGETTNVENNLEVIGVAMQDIEVGKTGIIQISGFCECNVTGPIFVGDTISTSSTYGLAKKSDINPFAIAKSANSTGTEIQIRLLKD